MKNRELLTQIEKARVSFSLFFLFSFSFSSFYFSSLFFSFIFSFFYVLFTKIAQILKSFFFPPSLSSLSLFPFKKKKKKRDLEIRETELELEEVKAQLEAKKAIQSRLTTMVQTHQDTINKLNEVSFLSLSLLSPLSLSLSLSFSLFYSIEIDYHGSNSSGYY